jgi:hypothetical protein
MKHWCATLTGSLCLLLAALAPARADDGSERRRIARERAEASARFEARRHECHQRFAVTSCVDEARAEHRRTLISLRRQEAALDEAQRRQRAADRLAAIEEKQRAERERASAPAAQRSEPTVRVSPPRKARGAAAPASAPASAPDRSAEEARQRERFEARQREAQVHREQVERRRQQRDESGKSSPPLPDPAAR